MRTRLSIFILLCVAHISTAQTLGGARTFAFLELPFHAHVSAMGGIVVANPTLDPGLASYNPALLRPIYHNQLSVGQNFFLAGSSISNAYYVYDHHKSKTIFAGGINYLSHGQITRTDIMGNTGGSVPASEVMIQVQASRMYKDKWRYGLGVKYAQSQLASLNSMALLADAGIYYEDTVRLLSIGAAAKNFGGVLKKFNPQNSAEPMPFDIQVGISKKFAKAPFRLNFMGHSLYAWDIRYDNPDDRVINIFDTSTNTKNYTLDKFFRHVNMNVDILLGKNFELIVGYAQRRRRELIIQDKPGIVGFSMGAHLRLKKLDVTYARSMMHLAGAYNELSFNLRMRDLFKIGRR